MTSIESTLKSRNKEYGDYFYQSATSQRIKDAMRSGNWATLTPDKKDALEMIAVKISRIIEGNSSNTDSWHDIAGYATIIEKGYSLVEKSG